MRRSVRGILFVIIVALPACSSFMAPKEDYQTVSDRRVLDQIYIEDSSKVFFARFQNPYDDKEIMWIASYLEGDLELHIHDMENDSLAAILRFDRQESPLFPLAYRFDSDRLVKYVVHVNGRQKCARVLRRINILPHPQWGTSYSLETF